VDLSVLLPPPPLPLPLLETFRDDEVLGRAASGFRDHFQRSDTTESRFLSTPAVDSLCQSLDAPRSNRKMDVCLADQGDECLGGLS
jgi:hypothetical protein